MNNVLKITKQKRMGWISKIWRIYNGRVCKFFKDTGQFNWQYLLFRGASCADGRVKVTLSILKVKLFYKEVDDKCE